MTNARRKKIIKALSKKINDFTVQLNQLSKMKNAIASEVLSKMWLPYINISRLEADYQKLSNIVTDLKNVREAIKTKKDSATIICFINGPSMAPIEFCHSLDGIFGHLNYECDECSNEFYFY